MVESQMYINKLLAFEHVLHTDSNTLFIYVKSKEIANLKKKKKQLIGIYENVSLQLSD